MYKRRLVRCCRSSSLYFSENELRQKLTSIAKPIMATIIKPHSPSYCITIQLVNNMRKGHSMVPYMSNIRTHIFSTSSFMTQNISPDANSLFVAFVILKALEQRIALRVCKLLMAFSTIPQITYSSIIVKHTPITGILTASAIILTSSSNVCAFSNWIQLYTEASIYSMPKSFISPSIFKPKKPKSYFLLYEIMPLMNTNLSCGFFIW